jgi:aspartyl protease family protein
MFRILVIAMAFLCAGVVGVRTIEKLGPQPAPKAMTTTPSSAPPVASTNTSRSLELRAGQGGHFATDARVDGRRIAFVVDTGASQITIRESDAARLGFHPSRRDYTVRIHTANGEGRAAMVDLGMVEIGNIVVRDIRALVVPDDALGVNLLGMSFLSRVRWTHDRGRLLIEQ